MKNRVNSWRDLGTYKAAFELQQRIFQISKTWPREESYSLTDQIRRSSRSVGANIAESWSKRQYPAHFKSKFPDADGELQETLHWLDTANACGYIDEALCADLGCLAEVTGKQLGSMINQHESFCFQGTTPQPKH